MQPARPDPPRPLSPGEAALARAVFGSQLDLKRVRIVRRRRGHFAFVVGSRIHLPPGAPQDFAAASLRGQAWLVHELTHVWQFQTRPWRTLASWLRVALSGGYGPGLPGYAYRMPLKPWGRYNLEQQARLVEHQFLLQAGAACPGMPLEATPADYRRVVPLEGNQREIMDKADDPTQA